MSDNNVLNTQSIKNIIHKLTDIDRKIISLQQHSSDDFSHFNVFLRKYSKEAHAISDKAKIIFDLISGQNNNDNFSDLSNFYHQSKNYLDNFILQISHSISTLEKILSDLNLINIPLKNFKQNYMTLRYLEANLVLKNNLEKKSSEDGIINKINSLVKDATHIYPVISENINQLKASIRNSIENLSAIKNENIYYIDQILFDVNSSIQLLTNKHEEYKQQSPKLKYTSDNFLNSISQIITNIQYHDIIRQKMEHIQHTHKSIISQLQELYQKENITESDQAEYFVRIKDITSLQIAQLLQTNKDYQNAIDIITKKVNEIGNDITFISTICLQLTFYTQKAGETHFGEIKYKLESTINLIDKFAKSNRDFVFEITAINNTINEINQNIKQLKKINTELTEFQNLFISKNIETPNINSISEQIRNVSTDIQNTINSCLQLFGETNDLNNHLKSNIANYYQESDRSQKVISIKKETQEIKRILKKYDQKNQELQKLIKEINHSSINNTNEIKRSVEKITYYDYFDKIIDEIILELNEINQELEYKLLPENKDVKNRLEDIKKTYTTDSEHYIHKQFIDDDNIELFDDNSESEEEEDDNIEFF